MKVALPISLVILLLLNLFGFYIAYYVKLEGVRDEVEETLHSSRALQAITLSYGEYSRLQWTKPGRECRINGNMYDVAKTETFASGVRLYVRMDEDETVLDDIFAQNFQSKQELPGTPVKLLVSLIGQDFIVVKNRSILPPIFKYTIFQSTIFSNALTEGIIRKISPPPWC